MAKRNISAVNNMFIYHDNKNRSIYWDVFTKKGYQLSNGDVGKLMLDKGSLPIAVILGYALISFSVKPLLAILISLGLYIVCKVLWRVLFLYKCPVCKDFKRGDNKSRIIEFVDKYSVLRLYALIALCVVLIGVMLYAILTYKDEVVYRYVFIALSIVAFILLVLSICAIVYKNKKANVIEKK